MAKKTTSNTFTVSTVEDGESAPYYFQEWFAWSNDTSTASVTTSPTIDGSWQTSIPNKGSYAYLWRKSIRFVWNEDTRTYSQESAQYFRMSGTDGTSIKTRGSVADASKRSSSGTATLTNGSTITMSDGDAVTQLDDGHLYQWVTESGGSWIDLGQFKGENGKTYFTHIVYATNVNYSGSSVTSIEGYTPTKSPNDTTHFWMGTYVDETSDDPISGSDPILLSYTWSYTKGNNGKDADFYTLVSRTTNVVKSSSSNPTYTPTSFYLRISHTVGNTTTQSAFVPSGYSVKYMKQSEDVWTTITLVNGAIPVQSSSSYFSDESFCDFALFNGDTIVSLITITRANDGAQGEKGEQGKIGRFFYYAGIFNRNNTSDTFVVSDVQAPYFRDSASASTYHVYNGTNGTYTMSQMWANSSRSFNNAPFESMTTQYKYIITEAVFSSNAHLGSFIVSGDWLISQYGTFYDSDGAVHTINADTVPFYTNAGEDLITKDMAFTWFDAEYPTSYAGGDGNFCPAFAVDGLTGKTYQQEAYISGKVNATGINLGQYTIDTTTTTTISRAGLYTISPTLAEQHGTLDLELDIDGFEVGDIITIVHPMANGGYYYDNAVPSGATFSDGVYMHFYSYSPDTPGSSGDARMFQPSNCGGIYVRADSDIWGIGGLVPMMDVNGDVKAYGFYPSRTSGITGNEIQIYFSGGTLELMVMLNEDGNKVFYVKSRQCMYLQAVMNEGLSLYPTVIESCGRVVACYTSNETWAW